MAFGKNREGYFLSSPKDEDKGGDLHLPLETVVVIFFSSFSFPSLLSLPFCVVLVFFTLEREEGSE